jgi:hypothetical protein
VQFARPQLARRRLPAIRPRFDKFGSPLQEKRRKPWK